MARRSSLAWRGAAQAQEPSASGLMSPGEVEAVGSRVTAFRPGDEVFGDLTQFGYGAFAEYAGAPERAWAHKPAAMTFEEAATVPQAAILALQGLQGRGRIKPGQQVLVNGASGNVGPFAVQIAKAFGAEVTGVCSTEKMDLVRSIGADHVIDYTRRRTSPGAISGTTGSSMSWATGRSSSGDAC